MSFVEEFGVLAFAVYGSVKNWEVWQMSAARTASHGIFVASPGHERAGVPGRLVQMAPLDQSVEELRLDRGSNA